MIHTKTLSYAELATLWGISKNAAKQRVIRYKWHRVRSNHDNKIMVYVPVSSYETMRRNKTVSRNPDTSHQQHTSSETLDTLQKLSKQCDQLRDENNKLKEENASIRQNYAVSDVSLRYERRDNERLVEQVKSLDETIRRLMDAKMKHPDNTHSYQEERPIPLLQWLWRKFTS